MQLRTPSVAGTSKNGTNSENDSPDVDVSQNFFALTSESIDDQKPDSLETPVPSATQPVVSVAHLTDAEAHEATKFEKDFTVVVVWPNQKNQTIEEIIADQNE